MAKVTGHGFVVPDQSAPDWLDTKTPESMDIRARSEYQSLDTSMDFLGSDSGRQNKKFPQPTKLKFLTE